MIDRALVKKIFSTVAALAATGAVVFAMQLGSQELVTHAGGDFTYEPPADPVVPAAKIHDLYRDVPEDLDLNVGGMSVARRTEPLDMPAEMAEKVLEARALAAGWERTDVPLAYVFTTVMPGESIWRRPDRAVVSRRITPTGNGSSRLDEYVFPCDALPRMEVKTAEDVYFQMAGSTGIRTKLRMPKYVSDMLVGGVIGTHRVVRGSGTAFYVTTVSQGRLEGLRREFHRKGAAEGWTFCPDQPDRAEKDNISVQVTFQDVGDRGAIIAVFRFADDENYVTKGTTIK